MDEESYNKFKESKLIFWPDVVGKLPPVPNQGRTMSCGGFALVVCMYGQMVMDGITPKICSAQQLLDVFPRGALLKQYFEYAKDRGVFAEEQYPWKGSPGVIDWPDVLKVVRYRIKDFHVFATVDEIKQELRKRSAIATSIFLSRSFRKWNREGIFNYTSMEELTQQIPSTSIYQEVHALVLVGFGTEVGVDYFFAMDFNGPEIINRGYMKIGAKSILYALAPIGPVTEYIGP